MPTYQMDAVLTAGGWRHDTAVTVSEQGLITAIGAAPPGADIEPIPGAIVPGMPNAHSHAFQRAMAGDTEFRIGARESFWTWREAMYSLANDIAPDELELIARQLFIEMLKAGYTSVAEFHYLHRPQDGSFDGGSALWLAVDAAAESAGIGLTLLPTLYLSSDFGPRPLLPEQQRFGLSVREFLDAAAARRQALAAAHRPLLHTGAALHSLRAVPLGPLHEAVAGLRAIDASGVIHIHVAEQLREVRACLEHSGKRPIELLLDTGLLDAHWCLVHATHATGAEIRAVADSGASICVCPSTEGNLGDGFFDAARMLRAHGGICIGSDSEATIDPSEELRWLEYQQRLKRRGRSVLATRREPHVGARLWREAARTGARALGQPVGAIEVGRRADWLVLDTAHPALAGAQDERVLDRLVFGSRPGAIRHVMVGGRWVIRDGRHEAEDASGRAFGDWQRRRSAAAAVPDRAPPRAT
jgi:formimidoylglutamate deiminase